MNLVLRRGGSAGYWPGQPLVNIGAGLLLGIALFVVELQHRISLKEAAIGYFAYSDPIPVILALFVGVLAAAPVFVTDQETGRSPYLRIAGIGPREHVLGSIRVAAGRTVVTTATMVVFVDVLALFVYPLRTVDESVLLWPGMHAMGPVVDLVMLLWCCLVSVGVLLVAHLLAVYRTPRLVALVCAPLAVLLGALVGDELGLTPIRLMLTPGHGVALFPHNPLNWTIGPALWLLVDAALITLIALLAPRAER
ncbi:hypothetical protein ACOQFL_10330 [Actinopolyspora sp. H202]|uniref:hypothetical protein n=1 Tax=Actinopolyspora sp. H202 TaxID=1500456 RepID=UPI003EE679E4